MQQELYETTLETALSELRTARQLLLQDMANYPSPISGCDAQFNRLLGDRTRLSNAIHALEDHPFVATPRVRTPDAISESR